MLVPTAYLLVASLASRRRCGEVAFTTFKFIFTFGNKPPATLGTRSGVTLGDDKSLIRLEDVVMAGRNNCFILRMAWLSSVPCSDSTTGCFVVDGVHFCFRSSSAAERRSIESVLGSLLFLGKKSTRLLSC